MNSEQFYRDLEFMLNIQPSTLHPGHDLVDIVEWDSMQVMVFVTFANEKYRRTVNAVDVAKAHTVDDLFNLINKV
jgi:acyl carrier protein